MRYVVVVALLAFGCASGSSIGPTSAEEARAVAIVWSGYYGMRNALPPVTWVQNCYTDPSQPHVQGFCEGDEVIYPDGVLRVEWDGSISGTAMGATSYWARAVESWRYLEQHGGDAGSLTADRQSEIDATKKLLVEAGL